MRVCIESLRMEFSLANRAVSRIKAYSRKHMAKGASAEKRLQYLEESAEYYTQAARRFPEDEEYYCRTSRLTNGRVFRANTLHSACYLCRIPHELFGRLVVVGKCTVEEDSSFTRRSEEVCPEDAGNLGVLCTRHGRSRRPDRQMSSLLRGHQEKNRRGTTYGRR